MEFNALDWVLLGLMLASLLLGAWRGLIYEVLSVAGWVAAFICAPIWAKTVAAYLPWRSWPDPMMYAAGFAAVFVGVAFVGGLVAYISQQLIKSVGLRPVDRALGAMFGGLRGLLIALAVAVVVGLTPLAKTATWQGSTLAQALGDTVGFIKPLLPAELGRYL
jgi:membrane protein required for colicin V production